MAFPRLGSRIADFLGVSQRTIQRWLKQGRTLLHEKSQRLNSRKHTTQQEDGVLEFLEKNAGVFLDEVKDFVSATYGVSISVPTACRLLSKHEITRKRATRVNVKYRSEKGMRFLEEIRPIYNNNPVMFASLDEMAVMLNLAPTYGYARKGRRAIVPQPGKRTVTYMVTLCISPVGVLYWNARTGSITAETFIEILERLPDGLTLMLDNAPVHHANKCLWKKGLNSVAELAEKKSISLKFIPSYAPHLNPVEHTFNLVRNLLREESLDRGGADGFSHQIIQDRVVLSGGHDEVVQKRYSRRTKSGRTSQVVKMSKNVSVISQPLQACNGYPFNDEFIFHASSYGDVLMW